MRLILAVVLSLGLAAPAWAQTCPMGRQECNNRCIAISEECQIADDSNKFLLLGVLVGVGALIGLGFYLNPGDDEPKTPPKAASPIDFTVHENGGGLLLRGTF